MQNWSCKFTKFNELSNSLADGRNHANLQKFAWGFPVDSVNQFAAVI